MSAAPETKYTDRDVRENDNLVALAYRYVEEYTGSFHFLIDCKMIVEAGEELSTSHVRGILNCMRVDPRVVNMPEPLPVVMDAATVVPITKPRRRKYPSQLSTCERTDFHDRHSDEGFYTCQGVFKINRPQYVTMKARVHDEYLTAAAIKGGMVHRIRPEAEVIWQPNRHDWGYQTVYMHQTIYDYDLAVLVVSTICEYPRKINKPRLFLPDSEVPDLRKADAGVLPLCKRCFPHTK